MLQNFRLLVWFIIFGYVTLSSDESQHQLDKFRQVPQMLDSKGNSICFSVTAYEKANQESEQLDHEPNKINVPKEVHQLYFLKF